MNDKLKTRIKLTIKKIGLKSSIDLFGKDIINEVYDNHLEFMNNFKDLRKLTNSDDSVIIWVSENNEIMFRYRPEVCSVMFNYQEIWTYFSYIKELDFFSTVQILKNWFVEFYKLPPNTYLDTDFRHDLQDFYYLDLVE
jgi:hypothetical protein